MIIYTMGFTQKNAETFFESIKKENIEVLIDVRLNNNSQLAGFSKGKDLAYFLPKLCQCKYIHKVGYAPTKELLNYYKKGKIEWSGYVKVYNKLIQSRKMTEDFEKEFHEYKKVLLLCSEVLPEQCHRRLLAEAIRDKFGYEIIHM